MKVLIFLLIMANKFLNYSAKLKKKIYITFKTPMNPKKNLKKKKKF